MVPFFDFAISLRMLDSGQDMLDLIFCQELAESTFRIPIFVRLVGKELRAMIGDNLSDPPDLAKFFKRLSHKVDAGFTRCCRKFSAGKNESRTIIEYYTHLFAIESTGMPIEMDSGKAVFSFVPYPWFSALLLFIVLIA